MPVTCLHGACFIKKQFNKTNVARFLLTADESTTVSALSTAVSRKTTLCSSSFTLLLFLRKTRLLFFCLLLPFNDYSQLVGHYCAVGGRWRLGKGCSMPKFKKEKAESNIVNEGGRGGDLLKCLTFHLFATIWLLLLCGNAVSLTSAVRFWRTSGRKIKACLKAICIHVVRLR